MLPVITSQIENERNGETNQDQDYDHKNDDSDHPAFQTWSWWSCCGSYSVVDNSLENIRVNNVQILFY